MKRATKYKNLICFAVVLVVLFSITAIPAYAEFPPLTTAGRRLGSWILSALTAANIALTSTASTSQGADLINFLADPLDVTYSYTEAWADRPTIQIWDDYVTIDGVTYTDIWISNEAASKFKTNGMDLATAYDIASQTNGTFASGVGSIDGIPIFDQNGNYLSQNYGSMVFPQTDGGTTSYATGGVENTFTRNAWHDKRVTSTYKNSGGSTVYGFNNAYIGQGDYQTVNTQITSRNAGGGKVYNYNFKYLDGNGQQTAFNSYQLVNPQFTAQPFDFDWVAGNIDASPLAPDEGMMIRVPSNTPGLDTFIQDHPDFADDDGTQIDINIDPDIMNKLDDLIDIIAPIIPILTDNDINFTINHVEPQPQPQPDPAPDVDPDTPVTDITYNDYYQTITNQTEYINNTVNNLNDNVENIYNQNQEIIENQDTIIENQDTIINDSIPEIIENIPKIDEICNNIDTAPYHDLDTGLDRLPSFFLPFITDLRSALGIWHYVTEWITQISTTFAFISGCLVGTSIMTPIYAAIAGFMCIKIYRRMTA